jgi:hypothetical protein
MTVRRNTVLALVCGQMLFWSAAAGAQQPQEHKGLTLLKAKCFQCHTDAMWRDHRQDSRAWEATLYRMVGRGGLWTTDEIKLMSEYLGNDFGPNTPPATPAR